MRHILKCKVCGAYTMDEKCSCGGEAVLAKPAKYSPEDKFGHLRRKVKKEQLEKEGLV